MKPTNPFADTGGGSSRSAVKNPFDSVPDLGKRPIVSAGVSSSLGVRATTEVPRNPYARDNSSTASLARNPFADLTSDNRSRVPVDPTSTSNNTTLLRVQTAATTPARIPQSPFSADHRTPILSVSDAARKPSGDFYVPAAAPVRREPPTTIPSPQHSSPPANTKKQNTAPGPPIADQDSFRRSQSQSHYQTQTQQTAAAVSSAPPSVYQSSTRPYSSATNAQVPTLQTAYVAAPPPPPSKPVEDSTRSSVVRASKFRHVFCDPPKIDSTFTNFRLSAVTGEQNYIKANPMFFAVGVQGGGGPFAVVPLSSPGRFESENPIISGHSAPVLDFDFNPFNDFILASASEDQTVKLWSIPEGGLTSTITEPLVDLRGHSRKVLYLRFHPTASNVLASAAGDQTVKLWDIERGHEIQSLNGIHDQLIQDIVWDYTGSVFATSSKDKHVRLVDGRSAQVVNTIWNAHEGTKTTKLTFLGPLDKLITVGFTRQSQRQFKIWDPRNTSEEVKKIDIDHAAGTIMPFFDPDTNLLYLAGKGDGNVRYYEIVNETPYCYPLSEVRTSVSAKGMAWVPKRGVNVMACETARLLKLTTNSVEPLSFFVPRRSEAFQDDLYPDTASGEPAHTADQWLDGSVSPPRLMSLNPAFNKGTVARGIVPGFPPPRGSATPAAAPTAMKGGAGAATATSSNSISSSSNKSAALLQAELDSAHTRIHTLEERVKFLEDKLKSYGVRI